MKEDEGNLTTEEEKIMEIWKRYFQTILKEAETEKEEIV